MDFRGGWNPRVTDWFLDGKKPIASPNQVNCSFLYPGAVEKRLGYTKQGDDVSSGVAASDTASTTAFASNISFASTSVSAGACLSYTPGATHTMAAASIAVGTAQGDAYIYGLKCTIRANTANNPGAVVTNGTSQQAITTRTNVAFGTTNYLFTWSIPPTLTSGTVYWICIEAASCALISGTTLPAFGFTGSGGGAQIVKTTNDGFTNFSSATSRDLTFTFWASSPPIVGLYDYTSNALTQSIMAGVNSNLYYGTTWTSIDADVLTTQNYLMDFATYKDLLFYTNYSAKKPKVWDQSSTGAMAAGYRMAGCYASLVTVTPSGTVTDTISVASTTGVYNGQTHSLTVGGVVEVRRVASFVANTSVTYTAAPSGTVTAAKWLNGTGILRVPATTAANTVTLTDTNGVFVGQEHCLIISGQTQPEHRVVQAFTPDTSITYTEAPTSTVSEIRYGIEFLMEAAGGTIADSAANTWYQFMAVTKLRSGGWRASAQIGFTAAGGNTTQITIYGLKANSSTDGTQYGTDIDPLATTWFLSNSVASGHIYYKCVGSTDISVANPMPNNTTTFTIEDEVATTENTLELEYGWPQGAFTSQTCAPWGKYLLLFEGFMMMAGDPNYPSRVWKAALGAPNVWSIYGRTYGTYSDFNQDNGQIVTGLFAQNGQDRYYVHKNRSIYYEDYTRNLFSPWLPGVVKGQLGTLSHWYLKEAPQGHVFLSQAGPAVCYGSVCQLLPAGEAIVNKFDPNDTAKYNLAVMRYGTAALDEGRGLIYFGVSTTTATIRDRVLVYDYKNGTFTEWQGMQMNYLARIADANGFAECWGGNYSGQVFELNNGTSDNGAAIAWEWDSPNMTFGQGHEVFLGRWIIFSGAKQSSGTLYVDAYIDQSSTLSWTQTVDMSSADFPTGIQIPFNDRFSCVKLVLRNSDAAIPVKVDGITIEVEAFGDRA